MNIVHVNLVMGYTEGLNYQENCESICHARAGHNVTVLTTQYCFSSDGDWGRWDGPAEYVNSYGIHVIHLPFRTRMPYAINKQIGIFKGTYEILCQLQPDVICIHNGQFQDLRTFERYKRSHPVVRIFIDNHSDFSNTARTWVSRNIIHRLWWKPCIKSAEPYTEKFFGVMPSRVDFLVDVYGIDRKKCDLLFMGADDDAVASAREPYVRKSIRENYDIEENKFLIVTGGKIDAAKTQTLLLMEAVQRLSAEHDVKLLIFGTVIPELREQFSAFCDGETIQYIGWAEGNQSYEFFAAADLVVFPGRHSVYWEQTAGLGIPMICKYWPGTTHVDLGGNVEFLYEDSTEEIENKLLALITAPDKLERMRNAAESGRDVFSYRRISEKAIGM